MTSLKTILITMPLSLCAFVGTFYTIGRLMLFLSTPVKLKLEFVWILNLMDNFSRLETSLFPLTIDLILIILFILQHSLMRSSLIKGMWNKIGLETAERSIYNLATAGVLHIMLQNWKTIPTVILWQFDVEQNVSIWWCLVLIHVLAWTVIYGGSILMDLPELLGIKQLYYNINNYGPPMAYKSRELRKLYGHVRHPSFVGLSIILWFTNVMSLDRIILASMWSLYMYIAWTTDNSDVNYHRSQLQRKKYELSANRY